MLLGLERTRLVGKRLAAFVASGHADDFHRFMRSVFQSTVKCAAEIDFAPTSAERVHVHIEAVCVHATRT